MRRLLLAVMMLLALAVPSMAQLSVVGSEVGVNFPAQGGFAVIANNAPATNFTAVTGLNTFILPLPPNVAARIYLTNETANPCIGVFTVTVAVTGRSQTQSFNNALQAWQIVPVQGATAGSGLTYSANMDLPALATVYVTTTALTAPFMTVQVVNTTGGCPTTNIDVSVILSSVSITAPLVSVGNGTSGVGANTNVEGVSPAGGNAGVISPIVLGGAAPASNSGLQTYGVDTVATQFGSSTRVITPTLTPSNPNEFAIAFINPASGGDIPSPGWTLPCGVGAGTGSGTYATRGLTSTASTFFQQSSLSTEIYSSGLAMFAKIPTQVQAKCNTNFGTNGGTLAYTSNVTAGDSLTMVLYSNSFLMNITGVTDTLGNAWKQIAQQCNAPGSGGCVALWSTPSPNGGADTVTITGTNTFQGALFEYTSFGNASPNTPLVALDADSGGALIVRQDAQPGFLFDCSVTISTNTTTQCPVTPLANLKIYVTDFQIQTTTAGTATTIQLVNGTGSNCGTGTVNLSAITYPTTPVGLVSIIGPRTPLISPVNNQVCVKQAGTTAGTIVVELRGFIAP